MHAQLPSHAEFMDKTLAAEGVHRHTCNVSVMLRLIDSAIDTVTAANGLRETLPIDRLVNKYNKEGVTALAVAARAGQSAAVR